MKLKNFVFVAVAIVMCALTPMAHAQQRSSSSTASAPSLDCAELAGTSYIGWSELGNDKGVLTYYSLHIYDYFFKWWGSDKDQFIGTWGVAKNKLQLKSTSATPITFNLESKNGGKTFTGSFINSKKNYKGASYIYRSNGLSSPMTAEKLKEYFKNGATVNYLDIYFNDNKLEMGVPVNISVVPDEDDENSGYIKLQSSSEAFPGFGVTKFKYTFEQDKLIWEDNEGNTMSKSYSDFENSIIFIKLGNASVPSLGRGSLFLYFIKK